MSLEAKFLDAVEQNQVEEVKRILSTYGGMINLQCRDSEGRNPLMIAIQEGYLDVIHILLEHDVYIGDALLMAVEVQFAGAVKALCRYSESEKVKIGKDFVNGFPSSVNFPPGSNPLQLAAILNDYTIVKILLDYGARIPSLKAVLARIKSDSFERALAQLRWYQAITSQAYLLLASEDPMDAAFWLANQLRTLSNTVTQLKEEYEELSANLEQFVTRLLGFARNLDEIEAVLGAQRFVADPNTEIFATRHALPVRLQEAIKFDFKRFVAHSTCQDYMLSRWYSGSDETWRKMTSVRMASMSSLIMVAWPFLCLFYIFTPWGKMSNFIRTPYVRFLLHAGSRLTFLVLLLFTSVTGHHLEVIKSSVDGSTVMSYRVHDEWQLNQAVPWIIFFWIIGMTWREMKGVWRRGIRLYVKNGWNMVHTVQLMFYWIYIALSVVSYIKVDYTFHVLESDGGKEQRRIQRCETLNQLFPGDSVPARCINNSTTGGSPSGSGPPKVILSPHDPLFIAEAAFAIANVLTQLGLLNAMVAMSFVGPLHISMGGMARDIGRFLLLFSIVGLAFSLGMTQIFRTYEMVRQETCEGECEDHAFGSLWNSIETLFWSLFDLMNLDNLKMNADLGFSQVVGTILYAAYSLVGVVVLLNALIAMMSNTYTRVEENSDVEWKVARTRLMTEYLSESATIPPPLNIIPSMRSVLRLIQRLAHFNRGSRPKHQRKEALRNFQHDGYQNIVRKLVQRYLWQEKMMRVRVKRKDKVHAELLLLKDAVEMVSSRTSVYKKRRLQNTISAGMSADPYLKRFYRQISGDNIRKSVSFEELETYL
ncbi:short transient receptor potential channel 5-like isoform X2 [Acanthaster planci]|uniref:Short transient receptor potential channel 5-like isoform X2 n=1 Tax=Acanthaster planci TaxID=133434 RepID=A0A8B7XZM5_ACAPL|nr:short transient receptor potential channel 5-like isoform X2 [Acanthaster planci]